MSFFDHESILEVDVVMGAYMLIRREVFEKAGSLDESYFMYTEEIEFCYRAKKQGYKIYFTPSAQIIHYGGGSSSQAQSYFDQIHQSQLQFIRSHFQGAQKCLGIFLKELGIAIRVPGYFFLGLFTSNPKLVQKSRFYAAFLIKTWR
jgi:GT2 family glycosyltransferase